MTARKFRTQRPREITLVVAFILWILGVAATVLGAISLPDNYGVWSLISAGPLLILALPFLTGKRPDLGEENMAIQTLVIWIIVGAVAGYLADAVVGGIRVGLVGAIIVGIVGALIGGWLLGQLGLAIGGGILGEIITAFIGAVILLLILRAIRR